MIPCILLALGGNLVEGPGSSQLGTKTTAAIIFARLVLVPPTGLGIVTLADKLGFLPPGDKMFKFVLLLQHTMPTSVRSGAVASLRGCGREAAAVLFWVHIFVRKEKNLLTIVSGSAASINLTGSVYRFEELRSECNGEATTVAVLEIVCFISMLWFDGDLKESGLEVNIPSHVNCPKRVENDSRMRVATTEHVDANFAGLDNTYSSDCIIFTLRYIFLIKNWLLFFMFLYHLILEKHVSITTDYAYNTTDYAYIATDYAFIATDYAFIATDYAYIATDYAYIATYYTYKS
ncbi:hypothetical protein QQ045_011213 [Rhodiola kirilowii]